MSRSAERTRAEAAQAARVGTEPTLHRSGGARRSAWRRRTPYLFLLPALALELFVHFGPMIAGLVMSALKLTQYQLARWWEAPWAGLANYRVVLDVNQPTGASLLHS